MNRHPITKIDLDDALNKQDSKMTHLFTQQESRIEQLFNKFDEKFTQSLKILDQKFTQSLKAHDEKFTRLLKTQDEKIAERLMKHFYTKDEIDRKLSVFVTKEEHKKAIDEGIDRVMVLFEDSKSKFELIAENLIHTNKRVDGLDNRVLTLEREV